MGNMRRKIWVEPELDIKKTLAEEKFDALLQYAAGNQQYIMEQWWSKDRMFLGKVLRFGASVLHRFEHQLQEYKNLLTVFKLGSLMGTVESLNQLLREERQDEWSAKMFKEEILSVKHLDEIVLTLELYGLMSHAELSETLGLKVSTLTEIMKKADTTHLISSSRVGKYKVYSLTDVGKRIGKQLRKEKHENLDQEIIDRIEERMKNMENMDQFIQKIIEVVKKPSNIQFDYVNTVNPGDELTVCVNEEGSVYSEKYEVQKVLCKDVLSNSLRIAAKKRKSSLDGIYDYENENRKERLA